MTLPHEQYDALVNAKTFLVGLLDPKATTKVPKKIRKLAEGILKHYPSAHELDNMVRLSVEEEFKLRDPIEYSPCRGGWIFWDETESETSRAFLTREDAHNAFMGYNP